MRLFIGFAISSNLFFISIKNKFFHKVTLYTAWKVSKYGVFSDRYFHALLSCEFHVSQFISVFIEISLLLFFLFVLTTYITAWMWFEHGTGILATILRAISTSKGKNVARKICCRSRAKSYATFIGKSHTN